MLLDALWACTILSLASLLFCQHWALLLRLLVRQQQVERAAQVAIACLNQLEQDPGATQEFTVEVSQEPAAMAGVVIRKVTVYGTGEKSLCTFARFTQE